MSRYFDLLVDLLLVRSPKDLVRDSGLVHSLLGLADGVEVRAAALTERVRAQSTGTEAP